MPTRFSGMNGGNTMVIMIFVGGILLNFLLGFGTMAIFSAILQRRQLQKIPVYGRLTPPEN
jgi:hypothetical protein